jgi:hypothetical protein
MPSWQKRKKRGICGRDRVRREREQDLPSRRLAHLDGVQYPLQGKGCLAGALYYLLPRTEQRRTLLTMTICMIESASQLSHVARVQRALANTPTRRSTPSEPGLQLKAAL